MEMVSTMRRHHLATLRKNILRTNSGQIKEDCDRKDEKGMNGS